MSKLRRKVTTQSSKSKSDKSKLSPPSEILSSHFLGGISPGRRKTVHTKLARQSLRTIRRVSSRKSLTDESEANKSRTRKKGFAKESLSQIQQLKHSKDIKKSSDTCGFCGKVFSRKTFFISHLLKHNEEKLKALNCHQNRKDFGDHSKEKRDVLDHCQNQITVDQCRELKLEASEHLGEQKQNYGKQKLKNLNHCKELKPEASEIFREPKRNRCKLKQKNLDCRKEQEQKDLIFYREQKQQEDLDHCQEQECEPDVPAKDEANSSAVDDLESDHEDDLDYQDSFSTDGVSELSITLGSDGKELNPHAAASKTHRYFCPVCGKGYSQRGSLTNHEASHTGKGAHRCTICDDIFNKKSKLTRHMREHHHDNPPVCLLCRRTFKSARHLQTHMSVHRDFTCDVCGKKFARKHHLKFHQFSHSRERPLKCETCGKGFKNNYGLRTHQLCHVEKRRHICEQCGKGFKISSHLYRHLQGHTETRNFMCGKCGKSFKQKCHLKVHMYSHTGERRFRCEGCGKGFTQNSYLEKHQCCVDGDKEKLSSENKMVKQDIQIQEPMKIIATQDIKEPFKQFKTRDGMEPYVEMDVALEPAIGCLVADKSMQPYSNLMLAVQQTQSLQPIPHTNHCCSNLQPCGPDTKHTCI